MRTDPAGTARRLVHPLADPQWRRTLRFVIANTLAVAYAYYLNWPYAFLLPCVVSGLMMAHLPPLTLRLAASMFFRSMCWVGFGLFMLLPVHYMPVAGIVLTALAITTFYYFNAKGHGTVFDSTFMMVGVLMIGCSGSSIDASIELAKGIIKTLLATFPIAWTAFALLPDQHILAKAPSPPPRAGGFREHILDALRPTVVIMPLLLFLLSVNSSSRYMASAIKGAQIAEKTSLDQGREQASNFIFGTVVGAVAGIVIFWLLKLWPSLVWYTILTAVASSVFGWQMTKGPNGISPHWYRWGYANTTALILLGSTLMKNDFVGDDVSTRFYLRVLEFLAVSAFSTSVLYLYDAWRERFVRKHAAQPARPPAAEGPR